LPALGNRQKLLRQLAAVYQLSAHNVKGIESNENREQLRSFTHLPTKLARPPPLNDLKRHPGQAVSLTPAGCAAGFQARC
jgi:hypothetical protein